MTRSTSKWAGADSSRWRRWQSRTSSESKNVLKEFRSSQRVGVLCTVDMAGEGYDCPDIAVVGYATNKRTALYVRQVVARAMRVTDKERELDRIVPAQIVVPDVPELVAQLVGLLKPGLRDVIDPDGQLERTRPTPPAPDSGNRASM